LALKTDFKAMQRFENARRDAELLGFVVGESARPNRKNNYQGLFFLI
jgi:hypothetical protein